MRPTVESRPPVHAIVWRDGLPTVVSWLGHLEIAARTFTTSDAAIAHLLAVKGRV